MPGIPTKIDNDRLVAYLGLEFELCYLKSATEAVWILADKIRRRDELANEMLRIFHRFVRIGKALDRINAPPPVNEVDVSGSGDGSVVLTPTTLNNNGPYARCIGVRVRVHEHIAALHLRPGILPRLVEDAQILRSGSLLDPTFQLEVDDPILHVLTAPRPSQTTSKALPDDERSDVAPKRRRLPGPSNRGDGQ